MRRVANQASKRTTSSPVFGMRFLTEEELQGAVMGCLSSQTPDAATEVKVGGSVAGSFTIRLCGDGGDTDRSDFEESPEL